MYINLVWSQIWCGCRECVQVSMSQRKFMNTSFTSTWHPLDLFWLVSCWNTKYNFVVLLFLMLFVDRCCCCELFSFTMEFPIDKTFTNPETLDKSVLSFVVCRLSVNLHHIYQQLHQKFKLEDMSEGVTSSDGKNSLHMVSVCMWYVSVLTWSLLRKSAN